jgi:antitoxin component YwqK of YwqJK toxin-antitoxin module
LLEGLSEGWFTNGVLQVSEHFIKGLSHGLRTKYHENGAKLSEANIVSGTIEGIYQRWHENGMLAERVYLINGIADGEAASYFPDGSLKARVRLDHGTVVEQQFVKKEAAREQSAFSAITRRRPGSRHHSDESEVDGRLPLVT